MAVSINLKSADDPRAKNFVGAPPEELESLIDATRESAQDLIAAEKALERTDCVTVNGPGCAGVLFDFSSAMSDFQSQLDAWDPYL